MLGMNTLPPKADTGWLPSLGILLIILGGAFLTFGIFGHWTGGVPRGVMGLGGAAVAIIGFVLLKRFGKA
jgi:hypothetical protein